MAQTIEPPVKPPVPTGTVSPIEKNPPQEAVPTLKSKPDRRPAPKKLLARFEEFLIPALILFLIGNALAFALPNLAFARYEVGLPLCIVFLGILIYGIKQNQGWAIRLNLWLIILIAGSLHFHYRHFAPTQSDISNFAPLHRAEIMGTILAQPAKNRVVIQVSQLNGGKVTGQIQASLPRDNRGEAIAAGTRVLIDGELALPFQSQVPGAFNQSAYLSSQHITAILKRPSRMIAFESSNQPRYVLQRTTDALKQRISDTFAKSLPSPQSEILGGIVLGDKAIPVDKNTKQAFIQTGLIHLLAASGMNVGIIAGSILWLMSLLKVPYRQRIGITMGAVAFYSLLTGLPPSIQRATVMLEIALGLKLLNRELSPVFLLCIASTLLVAFNPESISSIGFQFSVLTTFGLLTMVAPLQEALGYYITRWLAGLILIPAVAQLWVWPLSVAYFNQFPIHTVPLNILALVLVSPLTMIGFIAGVLSLIHPSLGSGFSLLATPFLNGLLGLVQWGNGMGWAQWTLPSPAPWQIMALYMALFAITLLLYRFKAWSFQQKILAGLLPIALILGGTCIAASQSRAQTRLALLPLSYRHEAVLIQPGNSANANLLITPQNLSYFEAKALNDYFRHNQINEIGALILLPGGLLSDNGNLKTAFKKTRINLLVAQNILDLPETFKAELYRSFPKQGAQIQAGTLQIRGALSQLKVIENRFCLLSIQNTTQAAAGCGVQVVSQSSGTRLLAPVPLEAQQFYQLAREGNTLKIY